MGWSNEAAGVRYISLFLMEGTNRSGLQCLEHPREEITNFCVHFDCLKPLCPDCVEVHTRMHQRQEIESWKHCIGKAANQTKTTLEELRSIYEQQRGQRGGKSADVVESDNVRRLTVLREKYHRMVDEVFNAHENALRMQIRSHHRFDQPDTSKLKLAIEETQKVLMKLGHSSTVVAALKKALLLDHRALVEHFSHIKHSVPKQLSEVYFSEPVGNMQQFKTVLEKSVVLEISAPIASYSSPHTTDKKSADPFEPLKIWSREYFAAECRSKLLHFFIPNSFQLKILRVEEAEQGNWKLFEFKAKNQLPCYFKSIITPNGDIILTGGAEQQRRYKDVLRYSFQRNALEIIGSMISARSSHSICYLDNSIYLLGGFTADGEVTRQCEAFSLQTLTSRRIAPLNTPSANSCATPFNDQYIFKFGGIFNKQEGNSLIEMYSLRSDRWIVVTIDNPRPNPALELLSFSAATQINENDVLVFGGYDNSDLERPERICYSINVNIEQHSVSVRNYNTTPLPYAEGFWNNNPILHKGRVYALQNITDQQDELTALADERRVIIFNGERWL